MVNSSSVRGNESHGRNHGTALAMRYIYHPPRIQTRDDFFVCVMIEAAFIIMKLHICITITSQSRCAQHLLLSTVSRLLIKCKKYHAQMSIDDEERE